MKRRQTKGARPRRAQRSPAGQTIDRRTVVHPAAPGPAVVGPVVGIGASAGGLNAFKKFFAGMPGDSGMSFVLIQHLDPTHESLTAELLGKHTTMSVVQVESDMRVEPNHVYVIPPNRYLSISSGVLRLSVPVERRGLRMPVDLFLRSLAEDQREHGIGIILSGTGTDGTLGVKEIKAAGGMTMAEEPATAQYDGMPRSAIATGSVDYVLPAEKMAAALLEYVRHSHLQPRVEGAPNYLDGILAVLRLRAKFDFGCYRKGTLWRRIHRRMNVKHVDQVDDYVKLLRGDPAEVAALCKDLLIGVTSFFRDPNAWHALQKDVLSVLVRDKPAGATLRVWVPGCGSGEEPYSIAMLLVEQMQAAQKSCELQIFASDVDRDALQVARTGVYPESIAADVPLDRLRRFFTKGEGTYRVGKEIRESVVFAEQNLISDPPFSKLDLITCRNLLIYLEPGVQKKVLALLHFALTEGGYLFLGSSETIGQQEDLFEPVSKKWRIYRRIGPTRHDKVQFPIATVREPRHAPLPVQPEPPSAGRLAGLAQQLLLQRYAPACVLINRKREILYFYGPTDLYLVQPTGLPTQDVIVQAREGLQSRLRAALQKAIREDQPVSISSARVQRGKTFCRVKAAIEPLKISKETEGLLLVSFSDESEVLAAPAAKESSANAEESLVRQLEVELKTTRDDLQSTIEELDTYNEELKAANEEVMSINEELQSTNEELETSKEELQSLNEELATVNNQLESKVAELEATNNDLDNLLTSTGIATVFLDKRFCVRRFTPAATRLFRLIPSDIGRPIGDIAQKFTDPDLQLDAEAVLDKLVSLKKEVQAEDGHCYMRQVLPYRTQDNRIDGVVVTFSDVAADTIQEARRYAEAIVETAADGIITIDQHGTMLSFNRAAEQIFGYAAAEVIGQNVRMLMPATDAEAHDASLARHLKTGEKRIIGIGREVTGRRKDGTTFPMDLAVSEFHDGVGPRFVGIVRDISERKRAEEEALQHRAELAHVLRVTTVGELAGGLAHEINQPLSAIANSVEACAMHVRSGRTDLQTLTPLLEQAAAEAVRAGEIVSHLRRFVQKRRPELEVLDLSQIVSQAVALLQREIEQQDVTLHLDVGDGALPVNVDRIQIEQVIVNLMQNAMDAIQDAGNERRELRVQTGRTDEGMAEVVVRDTGCGFSEDAAERLFEPFFTTKPHGLGMGLAISRSIVEAHSGRLSVAPGAKGTTVRFTLPSASDSQSSEAIT
jgi:two-component system CheB/CheR fusion protein